MTTDTWLNENSGTGGSADVINPSNGSFNLTETLVNDTVERNIYVGVPDSVHAAIPALTANDDCEGTAYAPLANLNAAFKKIQANGKGGTYKIFVSGNNTGNFTIPSGITTAKASSIEISTAANNNSIAVLNGNGNGTVLTTESATPVTLKNIKITGGNTESGGGIKIDGGNVILATGSLVTDNNAQWGAGVYVINGGSVTVKDGNISSNTAAGIGGAIFLYDGNIYIKNGANIPYGGVVNNNDVYIDPAP